MRAVSIRVPDSILTTVAPKSARARPTTGPATTQLKSATFSPASGGCSSDGPLSTKRPAGQAVVAEPVGEHLIGVLAELRSRPAQLERRDGDRRPPSRHGLGPATGAQRDVEVPPGQLRT